MESGRPQRLFLIVLFLQQPSVSRPETFQVLGPAGPVVAVAGEDAVLPCYLSPRISAEGLEIRWIKEELADPVFLYQNQNPSLDNQIPSYRGRAALFPGELSKGNTSLKLAHVRGSDDGRYKCHVQSLEWYEDAVIQVAVRAVGGQPVVSVTGHQGQGVRLGCESKGWFPEPEVVWLDSEGQSLTADPTETHRDSQDLFTVRRQVTVQHSATNRFTCRVEQQQLNQVREAEIDVPSELFPRVSPWMVMFWVILLCALAGCAVIIYLHVKLHRERALGSQPSVSLHSPGGDQAQLLCRSEGWFPQPAVIWTDRDGNEVTSQPPTVDTDSQGLLSVRSYIPVKQESNIFSCLVRSTQPKADWESQLHIPRDYFPAPSGWMVTLFLTAAVTVAASVLLVIQWRRMDREEKLNAIPVILTELDAVKRAPIPKSQWQWLCSAAGEGSPIPDLQWQWLCSAAAAVNLDPDTAHCGLSLSEDGKRVREGERKSLSDNPHRFDYWPCVVSREAFTSGRHYWEVEVNDDWRIGVTRESARKKGEFRFVPQEGYWLLKYWWLNSYLCEFSALTDPETPLPLSLRPRKLGVCVDIEERKVSFYTVESRAHVYTFTDMVFTQGEKIYPVFWTEDRNKALELLPAVSVEIKPVTDS